LSVFNDQWRPLSTSPLNIAGERVKFSILHRVEAETLVTLANDASPLKPLGVPRKGGFDVMLNNNARLAVNQARAKNIVQEVMIRLPFVWRVQENRIRTKTLPAQGTESCKNIALDDAIRRGDTAELEIPPNKIGGFAAGFDEDDLARSATQRFQANRAGPGKNIQENCARNRRTENVEEGFLQAITGGAQSKAPRTS
jgi:hypothetical protein